MKPRNEYLATNVINGKFIAMSSKGKLSSWDIVTGKKFPGGTSYKHYSRFEVYAWNDKE
jgi:hypothetical protein